MRAPARSLPPRTSRALVAAGLTCVLALVATAPASAQPIAPATSRGHWRPAFRRVGIADYVWCGTTLTGMGLEVLLLQSHPPPLRFNGPILFDTAVRDAIRYGTTAVHDDAATVGWAGLLGLLIYPVAVDVPVAWARGGAGLAWQFVWQDAIVLSTAGALDLLIRDVVGRARPYTTDCLAAGRTGCVGDTEATRSFPGGHMAISTAAAALICTQHLYTQLYGRVGDPLVCGVALALDVTVGVSRIIADVHWTSDIIAGSLLGGLIGWGVPTLMWYGFGRGAPFGGRSHAAPAQPSPPVTVAPVAQFVPGGGGLGAMGRF